MGPRPADRPPPRPAAPATAADAPPSVVRQAVATAAAPPGTNGGVVERVRCPAMPDVPRGAVPVVSADAAAVPGARNPSVAAPADAADAAAAARARRPAGVRVTGPPGRADPAMHRRGRRSLGRR